MTDFAAYVFYVNRPDLLDRAIDSFPALFPELTVIDNSAQGMKDDITISIYSPPVPLTYSQSMNWMLKDALEKGVKFILHFHSDAFSTNPDCVDQLLSRVREFDKEGRRWGCAWTFYDILWAINPIAMREIGGWDTELPSYFTDNDVNRRLGLAGWETIDTHIEGVNHEGSATINSDPHLRYLNGITFPLRRQYYEAKWGGGPGSEKFYVPFNGEPRNG